MKKKDGSELTFAEKELIIRRFIDRVHDQVRVTHRCIERTFAVEIDDKDVKTILQVYGESYLLGNAFVTDSADIDEDRAVLVIDNLGDDGQIITAYQQRDNSIGVTYRDYNGYCETFESLSQFEDCVNKYTAAEFKEEYLAAINLIKIRFNQHTN